MLATDLPPVERPDAAPEVDPNCCKGLNDCKGQGGCAIAGVNECAGKNECKGKGGCRAHCPR